MLFRLNERSGNGGGACHLHGVFKPHEYSEVLRIHEQIFGPELNGFLAELASRFPYFDALFERQGGLSKLGRIVEKVGEMLDQEDCEMVAELPDGFQLIGFVQFSRWIFSTLLQSLPIEQLTQDLREQRLALDLGL